MFPDPALRLTLGLLLAASTACSGSPSAGRTSAVDAIVVASFDFTESVILAELYGQALEANGFEVELALEAGPRELLEPALERGLIDFVPEYLGSALGFLQGRESEASADVQATHLALAREFDRRGVAVLRPAPAQDANGIVVTPETAERYGLETISDLVEVAEGLSLGGPPECPDRPLCLPGLERAYGLRFEVFVPLDASGPITAGALQAGEVDVAVMFTTSGYIDLRDFVLLLDDRRLQPAENVVPVVRAEIVDRYGSSFESVVDGVSRRLTTDDLIDLNRRVGLEGHDPQTAARDWLRARGLVD
jgi:osmoprotectant transport system substrate-binding protein